MFELAKNVIEQKKEDFPIELARLILFAKEQNADVLCLDQDADEIGILPTYEW